MVHEKKTETGQKNTSSNLTIFILVAMVFGATLGAIIHNTCDEATAANFSSYIKILATVFIRLVVHSVSSGQ